MFLYQYIYYIQRVNADYRSISSEKVISNRKQLKEALIITNAKSILCVCTVQLRLDIGFCEINSKSYIRICRNPKKIKKPANQFRSRNSRAFCSRKQNYYSQLYKNSAANSADKLIHRPSFSRSEHCSSSRRIAFIA